MQIRLGGAPVPVKEIRVLWPNGNSIERFLAHWFKALSSVFQANTPEIKCIEWSDCLSFDRFESKHVCVLLPGSDAYAATFDTRTASLVAQKKIFEREVRSLAPLAPSETCIVVQRTANAPSRLQFLQVRQSILESVLEQFDALGKTKLYLASEYSPECRVLHPGVASVQSGRRKALTLGIGLCLAGLWSLISVWEANNLKSLQTVSGEETRLRSVLLEQLDADAERTALAQLEELDPVKRAPQARLEDLSRITVSTDDSTWWQVIEFDGVKVHLNGRSQSAAKSLTEVSNTFSEHNVTFSDSVSDAADGDQVFSLALSPQEALR